MRCKARGKNLRMHAGYPGARSVKTWVILLSTSVPTRNVLHIHVKASSRRVMQSPASEGAQRETIGKAVWLHWEPVQ
eukprot:9487523-Karenia_brevis.AAC.1